MTGEQLNRWINLLATVTLVEMMVTIGMGVTFARLLPVARNGWLVARAALANYVCVPAAAVFLLILFRPHSLDPEHYSLIAAGFLIAAVCPGAPYGPLCTSLARGNGIVSVSLMVLLAGSSALFAPLLLHLLLPVTSGEGCFHIDALKVVNTLLFAQLLPLTIGLAVRQWQPGWAEVLHKPARLLSAVLNGALLTAILSVQFDMLIHIPLRGYGGMFVLVLVSVTAGWLLGGPGRANRTAMAMATSIRNVGVALVIATASFAGTRAVTAATAFALFQTILMFLVALVWGRMVAAPAEDPVAARQAGDAAG